MPTAPMTGDQRFVKNLNRMALLRLLRDESGLSRADLANRSGLTKSTVSLIAKELIDEGWLAEDGALVTGALGRRPTPLRIDGRHLVLIGSELDTDIIRVVAVSIRGEVLEMNQAALKSKDPDAACHQLVQMVTAQSAKVTAAGSRLLGIGVGLPGAVDSTTGVLQFAPNIGWRGVEVGKRLGAELTAAGLGAVPVYFQNEADLAAVGEAEFGARPVEDPLVYVSCGVGVGSGIILNDSLFTGATGSAGEIGHTTLFIDGRPCSCGRLGCAEAYMGLKAVAEKAGCLDADGHIDRAALKALAGKRAASARDAFGAAGDVLGVLLQNVWTTFNPQVIVLGGESVGLGGEQFLQAAIERLEQFAKQAGLPGPDVRVAKYAELATAVGGAAFALHSLLRPYSHAPTARASVSPVPSVPVLA
ncbi:ROK family transcriptional regulator [Rhizobacter sp. Root1221]|uniref:ROK family transcriptional regulator n=1 Tax=Rhizobacter sp. Root1221 TaxID=1736433 RepID=UPI000A423741|nr:ROK family transcriptional regulator [Rhizobacter sp. Root1221]